MSPGTFLQDDGTFDQVDFSELTGVSVGQYPGTVTNDNASAGNVGELISSILTSSSAVSLVNSTPKDITTIPLTAGDFDVWGTIYFTGNAATTVTQAYGGVSTSANAFSTGFNGGDGSVGIQQYTSFSPFSTISGSFSLSFGPVRILLAANTTYHLVAELVFATNIANAFGSIYARRRR